jgi:hypothetical protein
VHRGPFFTKDLYIGEYHLGQFVEKLEQLLLEVIQGMDATSKAALGLIYMRKNHLESPTSLLGSEPQALGGSAARWESASRRSTHSTAASSRTCKSATSRCGASSTDHRQRLRGDLGL